KRIQSLFIEGPFNRPYPKGTQKKITLFLLLHQGTANMPKELPGFYYDAEKNRYFPLKGPIPGSSYSSAKKPPTQPTQATNPCKSTQVTTSKLLEARELNGNVAAFSKGKCNIKEEFQKRQASHPVVWKYQSTEMMADGALEQIHIDLQTPEGQTGTDILLTGSSNGSLRFAEVGKIGQHFDSGVISIPHRLWPLINNKEKNTKAPKPIWRPPRALFQMDSNITCVKLSRKRSSCTMVDDSYIQQALITTLGSETSGGSVYILNLVEPLDIALGWQRLHEVGSYNCTIWTADCKPNSNQALIGTNLGAALINLETGVPSWVFRSKSDVLAQQLDQSGNIVLCGLRNGAIVTVDVREKREGFTARLIKHRIPNSPLGRTGQNPSKWFELKGNLDPSHTIYMPSSVSCLRSLKLYDQYFLASSLDGSVKLYDHRLSKRGAVQSYEGHVNSHTHIQLGVDPSERFVMSGGEDYYLRLWSIKSGELLLANKFFDSVPSTVCWRRAERFVGMQDERQSHEECLLEENHLWKAWLGSREGLFQMHWS
ncbi:hypothetical protein CFOL_v3_18540, partial [Cephalotus follicularis]